MIIQGPEACDDPKMSGTIAVSYSSLILCALCHIVWGHKSFTIFLYPLSPQFLSISVYLHTGTAEKIICHAPEKDSLHSYLMYKRFLDSHLFLYAACTLFDGSET